MSILQQKKGTTAPLPRLEGKEVLVGAKPDIAKVKGVMFGARKQFLIEMLGEQGFYDMLLRLSPRTMNYTRTPLASSWCEFESLIELDRTIYETAKGKCRTSSRSSGPPPRSSASAASTSRSTPPS